MKQVKPCCCTLEPHGLVIALGHRRKHTALLCSFSETGLEGRDAVTAAEKLKSSRKHEAQGTKEPQTVVCILMGI